MEQNLGAGLCKPEITEHIEKHKIQASEMLW